MRKSRRLAVYNPRKSSDFATNRDWLRKQMRVYTEQLNHHQKLAKLHGDHAKMLFGLARSGHDTVKPLLRQAKADADHHRSMALAHKQLIADVGKELNLQKSAEHDHTRQSHTRKKRVHADTYNYKQGEVTSPASTEYYAGIGIKMYNQIMRDLHESGPDKEFSTFIEKSNTKKANRLAIKTMQEHPLYPRMQKYFDQARKIARENIDKPERLGTLTSRPPVGMYYDERQFGITRTGI